MRIDLAGKAANRDGKTSGIPKEEWAWLQPYSKNDAGCAKLHEVTRNKIDLIKWQVWTKFQQKKKKKYTLLVTRCPDDVMGIFFFSGHKKN